jgi:hypothetical protein
VESFDNDRGDAYVVYDEGESDWITLGDASMRYVRKMNEKEQADFDWSQLFGITDPDKLAAVQRIERAHILWDKAKFDNAAQMYAEALSIGKVDDKEGMMALSRSVAIQAYFKHAGDDYDYAPFVPKTEGGPLQVICLGDTSPSGEVKKSETVDKRAEYAFKLSGMTDRAACLKLREAAELHANENGGWRDHHGIYHTTLTVADLEVHHVPVLRDFVNEKLETCIWPLLSQTYKVAIAQLRLLDCFFVRYDAAEVTNFLRTHTDESALSFVVELSEYEAEFEGGGTRFEALDPAPAAVPAAGPGGAAQPPAPPVPTNESSLPQGPLPEQGAVLVFAGGQVQHRGEAITSGRRYIIAGFVGVMGSTAADRL